MKILAQELAATFHAMPAATGIRFGGWSPLLDLLPAADGTAALERYHAYVLLLLGLHVAPAVGFEPT